MIPDLLPDLAWVVRTRVPFTWALSKNYAMTAAGSWEGIMDARQSLVDRLVPLFRTMQVVQDRLWLDVHVAKPNQRGDAVNFVDRICDAVTLASGIDDRWICLRQLTWSVDRVNPSITVGIGQAEGAVPSQVCSRCGAVKPFTDFQRSRNTKSGYGRRCRGCPGA